MMGQLVGIFVMAAAVALLLDSMLQKKLERYIASLEKRVKALEEGRR